MDSNPREKRLRNERVDRISDLPDSVLGEILSRLSVKNVIATSVLSTRWKTLVPSSVPLARVVLDDSHVSYRPRQNNSDSSSSRSFIDFVDKLLNNVTLRDVACVKTVVLNCKNKYGDYKIVSWVCAALRLSIENLRLMACMTDSMPLFISLHGCTSLVDLALECEFVLDLPGKFSLPNLKRLSLSRLSLRGDVNSVRDLIAGCPVLRHLSILRCDVSRLDNLYVEHPFITRLIIQDCNFDAGEGVCRVVIDAPNLETLAHTGNFVPEYVCMNFKSLQSIAVDFTSLQIETETEELYSQGLRLARLVEACSGTTCLYLYGNSVVALYLSSIWVPTFQNLTSLTLDYMGSCGWEMLAQFLKSAPNLAVLTFEEELDFIGAYAAFKSKLPSVPICLEQRLEKIEFWKFEWTPDEINLIEYFLKKGRVLREVIVHCLPSVNPSIIEKLSVLPKHSKVCRVRVLFYEDEE